MARGSGPKRIKCDDPREPQNDPSTEPSTTREKPFQLLFLPLEIRYMIWEFTIGADPILLYPSGFTKAAPMQVKEAKSATVSRKHILNEHCVGLYGMESSISSASKKQMAFLIIVINKGKKIITKRSRTHV